MRKAVIFNTLLVLVAMGCTHAASPQLAAQSVLLFTLALDMEQAQPGETDDGTPDQPDVPGIACMCLADPNYPCECRENPEACKHNPKCRSNRRGLLSGAAEQPDKVDWSLASLLESAVGEEKPADTEQPPVIVQAPLVVEADTFAIWKQSLPPTTIVFCTQPGCPPCKTGAKEIIAPLVAAGWHVVTVDIAHSPELAAELEVASTPTYIGFVDGKEVGRTQNPKKPPLRLAWPIIEGWFKPKATAATTPQINVDVIIATWFKGRIWTHTGSVRKHLATHGIPDGLLAAMSVQKQERLHSALHEMQASSGVPAVAPTPPGK